LLLIIPGVEAHYAYSLAVYVRIDNPNLSPMESLKFSKKLMDGHKNDMFLVDFHYLSAISISIFSVWFVVLATFNTFDNLPISVIDELLILLIMTFLTWIASLTWLLWYGSEYLTARALLYEEIKREAIESGNVHPSWFCLDWYY
jgi:uncharacterized membrane protein